MLIDESTIELKNKWTELLVEFIDDATRKLGLQDADKPELRKQTCEATLKLSIVAARAEGISWEEILDLKKDVELIIDQRQLNRSFAKVSMPATNGASTSPAIKAEAAASKTKKGKKA
jgi:hypothetical protein